MNIGANFSWNYINQTNIIVDEFDVQQKTNIKNQTHETYKRPKPLLMSNYAKPNSETVE